MSVNIPIGKYRITSDARQFRIVEDTIVQDGKNKGEPHEIIHGNYFHLGHAIQGLLRLHVLKSDAQSLRDILNIMGEFKKTIEYSLDEFAASTTIKANQIAKRTLIIKRKIDE